jgi:hypothetical protein
MTSKINKFRKSNFQWAVKTIIAVLTILFTAVSCSKDDNEPDPKTIQYRIKEERNKDNKIVKSYLYNDRNQVVKELDKNGEINKQYTYNNAGFLVNDLSGSTFTTYILDGNGRVLEKITNSGSGTSSKVVYDYNEAGKVIEEKYYKFITATNSFTYEYNITFAYNSNNLLGQSLQLEYVPIGQITPNFEERIDYQYDERGNAILITEREVKVANGNPEKTLEFVATYDKVKPLPYPNSILSKNNLIEYTQTEFDRLGNIKLQYTVTAKYTYNEAGYITKRIANGFGYEETTNYILEKIN